jgi:SMI1/KNR4 family protein SUKH-1
MNVKGFEPSTTVPTSSQIGGAEALLGVRFPDSYRTLLLEFNGACGDAEFPLLEKERGGSIGVWMSLLPWDRQSVWSTLSAAWEEHELPRRLIPFGMDGGGNFVCFDYRHSDVPSVVFWHHELDAEEGIFPVAATFEEFLRVLRAGET